LARAVAATRQALLVSQLEAGLAAAEVKDAADESAAVAARMRLVARSLACQAEQQRRLWEGILVPTLDALASPEVDSNEAVQSLAEALGLEDCLPLARDADFREFVANPRASIVFRGRTGDDGAVRLLEPSPRVLGNLGPPVTAPVPPARHRELLDVTADAAELDVSPFAGLHVSIKRKRGVYRHHGVLVGDGTIVHFSGSEDHQGRRAVIREPVASFLRGDPIRSVRAHFPHRVGQDPVPVFMPNLVVLRALHAVGNAKYNLLSRNCEHFGTWAQCGAMLSGQVDRLWRSGQVAAAEAAFDAAGAPIDGARAMVAYLDAWTMTAESLPLECLPASASPAPGPVLLDIGRVRWCRDSDDLLWWIPLWCSADPSRLWQAPFGPRDRGWTLDPGADDGEWLGSAPSIRLERSWHAALLADPQGTVYALDRAGRWYAPEIDLDAVVARRAAGIVELNQALARRDEVFERLSRQPPSTGPEALQPPPA